MKRILPIILATVTLSCLGNPDSRQGTGQPPGSGWASSISSYYFGKADMDIGGDISVSAIRALAGYSWTFTTQSRASLEFSFEWRDYGFSDDLDPWSKAYDFGISGNWNREFDNDWSLMVTPSIRLSMEDGASVSDALQAGGIIAFTREFSPALRLGIGMGGFFGLEDTTAFPFLMIRWQITDEWYIGNPFAPGPVGPAGLELGYRFSDELTFAVGGAWRSDRFRLTDTGPWADGYGEVDGLPVFFRTTYNLNWYNRIHFYVGTILNGELQIDDSSGRRLIRTDYDPALLTAISWQGSF